MLNQLTLDGSDDHTRLFRVLLRSLAVILCGIACYCPYCGLRGAWFCALPGLEQRSLRRIMVGATWGFVADIALGVFWLFVAGFWDPRWTYNELLVNYVPPGHFVMSHNHSMIPNVTKFTVGLMLWMMLMVKIWMLLWVPAISGMTQRCILPIVGIAGAAFALFLWAVAPLEGIAEPVRWGDLSPKAFRLVFFCSMPICMLGIRFAMSQIIRYKRASGRVTVVRDHL